MSKKASANMWWIIIGAVIALVVMIILMVMFTSKTGTLEGGLSSCEGKGGICTEKTKCPVNTLESSAFDCSTSGQRCCIGAPKSCTAADTKNCKEGKENCADGKYCYGGVTTP